MYTPSHLPETQALTEFREKTSATLRRLRRSDRPLLLTQNGKAAGVVLSPKAYADLADTADLARSIVSLRKGLADAKAGRSRKAADALDDLTQTRARKR